MVNSVSRIYLGASGWKNRTQVFLTPDCVETDIYSPVDLARRRIYLDDVLMVTHCKRYNLALLLFNGIAGGVLTLLGASLVALNFNASGIGLVLSSIPLGVGLALLGTAAVHLTVKRDVITVHGRRLKIEIFFGLKKKKVFEHYNLIVRSVRSAVARSDERLAREVPPGPPADTLEPIPALASELLHDAQLMSAAPSSDLSAKAVPTQPHYAHEKPESETPVNAPDSKTAEALAPVAPLNPPAEKFELPPFMPTITIEPKPPGMPEDN